MRTSMKWCSRHPVLTTTGSLFAMAIAWFATAYPQGMIAAYGDIFRGPYGILYYGYQTHENFAYYKLLRERYGVEMHPIAGCVVSDTERWYAQGYNSVSGPRIRQLFGDNIFRECRDEVHATLVREGETP